MRLQSQKRQYYRAACDLASTPRNREWLNRVLADAAKGGTYLRPIHIALIRLALRNTLA